MRDLTAAEPDVRIVWRAFELRPEPVPTLDPRGDYLQRAWTNSVLPLAERLGVPMRLPPVQPRSRLAHQAAHSARAVGAFDAYHAAVFRAFFERGEDIGRVDVLRALARDCGLDDTSLAAALESRAFEGDVLHDEDTAHRLGLSGVPAFVANRRVALTGVQPSDLLRELVAYARTPQPPRP